MCPIQSLVSQTQAWKNLSSDFDILVNGDLDSVERFAHSLRSLKIFENVN